MTGARLVLVDGFVSAAWTTADRNDGGVPGAPEITGSPATG